MESKTLTRSDLVDLLNHNLPLSRDDASNLIKSIFSYIFQALEKGEDVKITSFGTFEVRDKKERVGRNPKTKIEATILPRKIVIFRSSTNLKNKIIYTLKRREKFPDFKTLR